MDNAELFGAFKLAIEKEAESRDLYAYLAKNSDDESLKAIFQRFAAEESEHLATLLEQYKALRR